MRRYLVIALGLLSGLGVARPGDGAGTAPATQPVAEVASPPTTVKVVAVPWKAPGWQDAPDGNGEYLLFPSPHGQFEIKGRHYVTTDFGVLVRELSPVEATDGPTTPGPWRIVPELYTKNLQPLDVSGGLLWAVEAKPRGDLEAPVRVLALDVREWSVQKELVLPSDAVPVRVEDDGCWFVQSILPLPAAGAGVGASQRYGPYSYEYIVLLGLDGKEKFRFSLEKQPAMTFDRSQPEDERPPNQGICWWGIDPDAVWLGTMDYRSITPGYSEPPVYGPTQFIRVDRVSGKRTTVEAPRWPGMLTVNTPQRILWLEMADSPDGKRFSEVLQLDKKSQEISVAGRLDVGYAYDVAVDKDYLWVCDDCPVRAFSLQDFSELIPAGIPPATLPFRASPRVPAGLLLLDGDASRVWLAIGQQIVELPDDGEALVRQMPPEAMPSPFVHPAVAKTGSLYGAVGLQLFRVESGSDEVLTSESPLHLSSGFGLFCLGTESLWTSAHPELLAFTQGLVLRRRMPMPAVSAMTVVGETCFYIGSERNPGLFRLDPAGGDPLRIESWDKQIREWFKDTYDLDEPSPDALARMSSSGWLGTDGTGKVFLLGRRPSDPRIEATHDEVRMILWTYDIAKDQWERRDIEANLSWTMIDIAPRGFVLMSTERGGPPWDPSAYTIFSGGQLKLLGFLPEGWLGMAVFDWRWQIHTTDKYAYASTPLGLWRTLSGVSPDEE